MQPEQLKIETIAIENIGCLEHAIIEMGNSLTVVEGRNGVGKSTILNALRIFLETGSDPSLLRQGAIKGTVQVSISDGCQLLATITPDKTTRVVKHPKYGKLSNVREYIESIIHKVSFDPAAFLTANPADRVKIFLMALPKKLTKDQLSFLPEATLEGVDLSLHALEVIGNDKGGLYGKLYMERREINRIAKDKEGSIAELERNRPEKPAEGNWQAALDSVNNRIETLQLETQEDINQQEATLAMVVAQYNLEAAEAIGKFKLQAATTKAEIEREYQAKLTALENNSAAMIATREQLRDGLIAKSTASRDAGLAELEGSYQPKLETLIGERGRCQAMVEQETKFKTTDENIGTLEREKEAIEASADLLTGQLQRLEELKTELLSSIPIPGLEISEGQLMVDGLPYDRVNDSRKNRIAVDIMCLYHGELGLMVLDRAEIFDSENWLDFKDACKAKGVQILAARVTDCELSKRTDAPCPTCTGMGSVVKNASGISTVIQCPDCDGTKLKTERLLGKK